MAAMKQYRTNLAKLRKQAGLSQADAARKAKVSTGHWQHLEQGYYMPRLDVLLRMAKALRVDPGRVTFRRLKAKAKAA